MVKNSFENAPGVNQPRVGGASEKHSSPTYYGFLPVKEGLTRPAPDPSPASLLLIFLPRFYSGQDVC